MGKFEQVLADALAEGRQFIGQVAIGRTTEGGYTLCHRDDVGRTDLTLHTSPLDAREIATWDDAKVYRPLKTAPNLRHGWLLQLPDLAATRHALEYLYPAALSNWHAWRAGALRPTPLREMVNRQTGMYRITGKLSTEQADGLVSEFCAPERCLRTMLWSIEPDGLPAQGLPASKLDPEHDRTGGGAKVIPLLCTEMCCIVVAEGRALLKR